MKKIMLTVLGITIGLGIIYFAGMPIIEIFGKRVNEVERNIYEKDKQYIKGMADDIAKYMYDYNMAKNIEEKQSICQVVNHRLADFNLNDLNDGDLINFVRQCKLGGN